MSAEIIHGDCLEVMRGMADASVDAVITDPPYGTELLGGGYGRGHKTIAGDTNLTALTASVPELDRVLLRDGWVLVFCAAKMRGAVETVLAPLGRPFGEVVWDKAMPGLGYHIRYAHETVVVFRRGDPPRPQVPLLSVQRIALSRVNRTGHPHEKPVALMQTLVRWACPDGGTIIDPFCGSGSTLVAAQNEGRHFVGIEREAAYVEIARKRIADAQAQMTLAVG